jgi:hypothetical protein
LYGGSSSTSQAVSAFLDGSSKLATGSPAIDKGLNTYPDGSKEWVPGIDFEGNVRPQSSSVDIGWDEAPSAAVSTTTVVGSATNPSTFGQAIAFTATVTPNTATGTVHGDRLDGPSREWEAARSHPRTRRVTRATTRPPVCRELLDRSSLR